MNNAIFLLSIEKELYVDFILKERKVILLIKKFKDEEDGKVVEFIMVLAVIAIILAFTLPKTHFLAKLGYKEKVEVGVDASLKEADPNADTKTPAPPVSTQTTEEKYSLGGGLIAFMMTPTITASKPPPYYYNESDKLSFKANFEGTLHGYEAEKPYTCKWKGYVGYNGNSCDPRVNTVIPIGGNSLSVTMCDARGVCGTTDQLFVTTYKDPLLIMHESWKNYVMSGASGQWKYDKNSNIIYTTQNVDWSGFWNPDDINLQDYDLSFKMMASSPDTDDDTIGLTFRMTDERNFYFFGMDNRNSNGGAVHSGLYKYVNGKRTLLVDLMPLRWERNVWNDVRIKVTGTVIEVWLDGNKIAEKVDTSHEKGGYGPFTVSQAYGKFKDLTVEVTK